MSLELALLKGLLNNKRYSVYRPFVDEKIVFPLHEHQTLLEIIDEEFKKLDTGSQEDINVSNVSALGGLKLNGSQILPEILNDFTKLDISSSVFDEIFEKVKQRNVANQIALKAISVSEGTISFEELITFVEDNAATKLASIDDVNILSTDITTIKEDDEGESCLHWRMSWLNKSLGPLRRGNLGHIFAVAETGKTAFWVSEVTHMVQHTTKPIVIFFNEESGNEVIYRMYSSLLGIPYKSIILDKQKYAKQFFDLTDNKIIFIDEASLRLSMMEKVVAKYKPALVIIDNADKIIIKSQERRDLEIHNIYKWARQLAKEYCPVITVAHADSSAYGQKYLDESMMANSKVGKPAEMDFIIGIGREDGEGVARYLSLPKNKLRGDKDTVATLRHGRWPVALNGDISRFVDTVSENS